MQLVLFMLVVSLIAGLVAAGGDWMGHRAARRKIRFGKMRPRHVSRLFAVVTGVLISLVTFGVVFAVWQDAREALTKYSGVKKNLAQVEANLESMESSLSKARQEVASAKERVDASELEVEQLNEQLSVGRGQIIELAIELSTLADEIKEKEKERDKLLSDIENLEKEICNLHNQISNLNKEADSAEFRINSLLSLKNKLGEEIEGLETKVASQLEGEIVLQRGVNLAYERVDADEKDIFRDKLQSAINRVVVKLAKQNLDVDPETEQEAERFIQAFQQTGNSVIIVRTAQNVFENKSVLLAFEGASLDPILRKGGVLIEVKIKQSTASISAFGHQPSQVNVKSNLDAAGIDELISAIDVELMSQAESHGFLPNLHTGEISTNTSVLESMVEKLGSHPKPFIIRFIADEAITILDGLDRTHVVVTDAK